MMNGILINGRLYIAEPTDREREENVSACLDCLFSDLDCTDCYKAMFEKMMDVRNVMFTESDVRITETKKPDKEYYGN